MKFCSTFAATAVSLLSLSSVATALLSGVTIFSPPSSYTVPRTLYARTLLVRGGRGTTPFLLATWENYGPNNDANPYFQIYQSFDGGQSWSLRSQVHDQVNGWGLRYQPFLYQLPHQIGQFKAGTVLLAGNSIPNDLSRTQLDLYASTDEGSTWSFVSHIASGGRAIPNNGETPVWEPFLLDYNNQLVVYYSDQRDPAYGQKIVHQVSSDLRSWGGVVNDVAYPTYSFRPGMATVSLLPGNQWLLTYEFLGAPEKGFAVYYRISSSPLTFGSAAGHVLRATDGTVPAGSPYNVWTPVGGSSGSVVVSSGGQPEVFINHGLSATNPGQWIRTGTPEGTSYSRSLLVQADQSKILIAGGGVLGGNNNRVSASEVQV